MATAPHPTLTTTRLRLRPWRDDDLPAFAALNADPRVMEHFPSTLTRAQSDAVADRIRGKFGRYGFGFWAVEVVGGPAGGHGRATTAVPFIGFVGLSVPSFEAPFTPCVEVGWRLAAEHWGRGYATEAARAAVAFGFDLLKLAEIVAFTVPANRRSRAVMERLGMTRDPADDFEHPEVPVGHPIRPHVLYRLRRPDGPTGRNSPADRVDKPLAPTTGRSQAARSARGI